MSRHRIKIESSIGSGVSRKKYNDVVDSIAKKDYYEPGAWNYEGPKTPMNQIKTRGALNKHIAFMTRLGDSTLHNNDSDAMSFYRNKAKAHRRAYGEEVGHITSAKPRYEKAKYKRESEERLRKDTQERIGKMEESAPKPIEKKEVPTPKPVEKKKDYGEGLAPGGSSTIRGLNVKRLNSKQFQERAESNPSIMHHVNKLNMKASYEGTGNEDTRASGSAQDARDAVYEKEKRDIKPANTSHYRTEPFKIPDLPSSPKEKGLSTKQKLGIGAGVIGATGLGVYALRRHLKKKREQEAKNEQK